MERVTEWKGDEHGCVATFEGAVRACEEHRGPDWAHTCRPLDTCGGHENDEEGIDAFRCHGDDLLDSHLILRMWSNNATH